MLNGHSDELFNTNCGKLSWHSSVMQSRATNEDTRFVHVVKSGEAIPSGYETIACGGCNPFGNTATSRRLLSMQAAAAKRTSHKPRRILVNFDINKKKVAQRRLLSVNDASLPDVISQIMFANNIQSVVAGTASSGAVASSVTFKGSSTASDMASGTALLMDWVNKTVTPTPTPTPAASSSSSDTGKTIAVVACIVLALALLGLGGYVMYDKWMTKADTAPADTPKGNVPVGPERQGGRYSTKGLGKRGNIAIKL